MVHDQNKTNSKQKSEMDNKSLGLPAIMGMKIDLSIINRQKKKKRINKKFQHENILGDKFELPAKCKKLHPKQIKHFKCGLIKREDVLSFRDQVYKSLEKKDQEIFLGKYVKLIKPKSHNSVGQVARMMTAYYYIPKLSGEEFQVCKEMFMQVAAISEKSVKNIRERVCRRDILLQGDLSGKQDRFGKTIDKQKLQEKIEERREKILALDKGKYKSFIQAISGKNVDEVEDEEPMSDPAVSMDDLIVESLPEPKKKRGKYKTKRTEIERPEELEEPVIERNLLDLRSLEVCRICLQNNSDLLKMFRKLDNVNYSIADLVNYCLPIQVKQNDELPQKICKICFSHIKIACRLKKTSLESLDVMSMSLFEKEEYLAADDSQTEALDQYISNNTEEEIEEEEAEMVEEYLINEITEDTEEHVGPDEESDREDFFDIEVTNSEKQQKDMPDPSMRPRKCYLCDLEFETTPEDHFSSNHPLIEYSRCSKCEFEIEFPWFMNLHYQVHEDGFRLCPHCGKRFSTNEYEKFGSHKYHCSQNGLKGRQKKQFPCTYCGSVFKNQYGFKNHVRSIHTKETPYKCTECNEQFSKRPSLRRHLLKHGLGATAHCPICKKGFIHNNEMLRHKKTCNRIQ